MFSSRTNNFIVTTLNDELVAPMSLPILVPASLTRRPINLAALVVVDCISLTTFGLARPLATVTGLGQLVSGSADAWNFTPAAAVPAYAAYSLAGVCLDV